MRVRFFLKGQRIRKKRNNNNLLNVLQAVSLYHNFSALLGAIGAGYWRVAHVSVGIVATRVTSAGRVAVSRRLCWPPLATATAQIPPEAGSAGFTAPHAFAPRPFLIRSLILAAPLASAAASHRRLRFARRVIWLFAIANWPL